MTDDGYVERGCAQMLGLLASDEAKIGHLILSVRASLQEQNFWAYPPPLVDEDSRVRRTDRFEVQSGATVIWSVLQGYKTDDGFNASLELYKRYKYGRAERKYFRDRARREAARYMVKLHLFMIGRAE